MFQSKQISIVVSVYNEVDNINLLWESLNKTLSKLNYTFEVIFVNDGSTDTSQEKINALSSSNNLTVKSIEFSKNFGHEAAMIAGIDYATGDAIICMDADLQHPPAEIEKMIVTFSNNVDIVTMQRTNREDSTVIKSFFSKLFYKLINNISNHHFNDNASDFFLISKRVANILKEDFRERNRFLRGIIQIVGFNKQTLSYSAPSRINGKTNYSFFKLIKLTFTAITSFSKAPLYLGLLFGVLFGIFSLIIGGYSLLMFLLQDAVPSGYTTIILFLSINFSILFFIVGIMGVYIGYNFEESKKRPLYLIKNNK